MITVDEARELVNVAEIPFPQDWKDQILKVVEDSIKVAAQAGRKVVSVKGTAYGKTTNRYCNGNFNLSAEQLKEVSAILKQSGFGVGEDYRIRHDGCPMSIDILW
jgi:sugar phosphate isomerase/epimerase